METRVRILLVDDDDSTRRVLADTLRRAGYGVTEAPDGDMALALLNQQLFDLVLSDIWMGQTGGLEVLQAARQRPDPPEVVLMTGNSTVASAVAALRAGAFNYLMKPTTSEELLHTVAAASARHRQNLRRAALLRQLAAELADVPSVEPAVPSEASTDVDRFLQIGALVIDRFRHSASFAGQLLHLTPTEFALLVCLAESAGRVVTWTDIAAHTHQTLLAAEEAHELLRAHVKNLRRKIESSYLITVRGVGFMLLDPHEQPPPDAD